MYSTTLASSGRHAALPVLGLPPAPATLENLFASQPVEKFGVGEAVFWEGDLAAHVFQIAEGCLRLYRILPDGRRAVMGFRFAGENLGISCRDNYSYTVEAITPVRLRRLGRGRLQVFENGSERLRSLILAEIFEEIREAQQHIIVLGQLGAEERVASFLVSAARRTGAGQNRPIVTDLPMTRLDIADYLGLTIETVCRALSRLKREGLISLEGRHTVVLHRIGELRALAGELDEGEPPMLQPTLLPSAVRRH